MNSQHQQAYENVTAKITELYNSCQLPVARQDAKYGRCKFSQKFFSNPKQALNSILVNRALSDLDEVREMGRHWAAIATESIEDTGFSGLACSICFEDYLLALAINAMS
jgi:hypothetical protein